MIVSRRRLLGLCGLLFWGGSRPVARITSNGYELDRFFIAGFRYHEGRYLIDRMREGKHVTLRAEPENLHDAGALRVEFEGRHVGYVPRSRNVVPGRLLVQQAPMTARITSVDRAAEPWKAVQVAIWLAT
jgi:hypothetical protein